MREVFHDSVTGLVRRNLTFDLWVLRPPHVFEGSRSTSGVTHEIDMLPVTVLQPNPEEL